MFSFLKPSQEELDKRLLKAIEAKSPEKAKAALKAGGKANTPGSTPS